MTPSDLQDYLYNHIPLSAAMQVEVTQATVSTIELRAPLAPNVNHRGTAFGGSISTLATLAGWSLLRMRFDGLDPLPHLVIQRNTMEYLRPISDAFSARTHFPADLDWQTALDTLARRGKIRVPLVVDVISEGSVAARLEGVFVALTV